VRRIASPGGPSKSIDSKTGRWFVYNQIDKIRMDVNRKMIRCMKSMMLEKI
jgi:hypothetical protein